MANQTGLDLNIVQALKNAGWEYNSLSACWIKMVDRVERPLYTREHVVFKLWTDATNEIGGLHQQLLAASNESHFRLRAFQLAAGIAVLIASAWIIATLF